MRTFYGMTLPFIGAMLFFVSIITAFEAFGQEVLIDKHHVVSTECLILDEYDVPLGKGRCEIYADSQDTQKVLVEVFVRETAVAVLEVDISTGVQKTVWTRPDGI